MLPAGVVQHSNAGDGEGVRASIETPEPQRTSLKVGEGDRYAPLAQEGDGEAETGDLEAAYTQSSRADGIEGPALEGPSSGDRGT